MSRLIVAGHKRHVLMWGRRLASKPALTFSGRNVTTVSKDADLPDEPFNPPAGVTSRCQVRLVARRFPSRRENCPVELPFLLEL